MRKYFDGKAATHLTNPNVLCKATPGQQVFKERHTNLLLSTFDIGSIFVLHFPGTVLTASVPEQ